MIRLLPPDALPLLGDTLLLHARVAKCSARVVKCRLNVLQENIYKTTGICYAINAIIKQFNRRLVDPMEMIGFELMLSISYLLCTYSALHNIS